jgi:hypothetical protein
MYRKPAPAAAKKGRGTKSADPDAPAEHGRDAFTSPSGARYEGDWKRFEGGIKRHGKGEFTTPDFSYAGDFEEDLFHGVGQLQYASGLIYVGEFEHGSIHGEGEITFLDRSRYKGQWRNGRMHGIGTYYTIDGKQWTGQWCHGMSTCPIFPQLLPVSNEEEEEEQQEME